MRGLFEEIVADAFTQKNLVVDTLNGREFSYEVTLLEMAAKSCI